MISLLSGCMLSFLDAGSSVSPSFSLIPTGSQIVKSSLFLVVLYTCRIASSMILYSFLPFHIVFFLSIYSYKLTLPWRTDSLTHSLTLPSGCHTSSSRSNSILRTSGLFSLKVFLYMVPSFLCLASTFLNLLLNYIL